MPNLFENVFKRRSFGKIFGQEREPVIPYGPIRKILSEWEPMIPDRPKVFSQVTLPPGVGREEAIQTLASSPWATGWAEGMLRLAGVPPTEPDYERRKKELARRVAERMWD